MPAPVPYANLTNPQTLNLYAIVRDNPESYADLDGHTLPIDQPLINEVDDNASSQQDQNTKQNQTQDQPKPNPNKLSPIQTSLLHGQKTSRSPTILRNSGPIGERIQTTTIRTVNNM